MPFTSKPVFAALLCADALGTATFEAVSPAGGGAALAVGGMAFGAELTGGAALAEGSPNPHPSPGPPGGSSGGPARPHPASANAAAPSTKAAKPTRKGLCAKEFPHPLPTPQSYQTGWHFGGDILPAGYGRDRLKAIRF